MNTIHLKIVDIRGAKRSNRDNRVGEHAQKGIETLDHSHTTNCEDSLTHSHQGIMGYALLGRIKQPLVVATRDAQGVPDFHRVTETVTAIARKLLILVAKNEFAKALFELCACHNQAVQ